jgi:hypothetical protein
MTNSGLALIYNTRPTQREVPDTMEEREELRQIVAAYVQNNRLCAPIGINELKHHATAVLRGKNGQLNMQTLQQSLSIMPCGVKLLQQHPITNVCSLCPSACVLKKIAGHR